MFISMFITIINTFCWAESPHTGGRTITERLNVLTTPNPRIRKTLQRD